MQILAVTHHASLAALADATIVLAAPSVGAAGAPGRGTTATVLAEGVAQRNGSSGNHNKDTSQPKKTGGGQQRGKRTAGKSSR
jgi:hypothetical protein